MKAIAVINQKGGSGKTTTAVNLAAALAGAGQRVLLVDLDPQAAATAWLGSGDAGGAHELFLDGRRLSDLVESTRCESVGLVPSSHRLMAAESLAGQPESPTLLRRHLEHLDSGRFSHVLFDVAPGFGMLTINALAAATELLVPVTAHALCLMSLARFLEAVEGVRRRLNPELRIGGIVVCRWTPRTRHSLDVMATLRERFDGRVHATAIRECAPLAECPAAGRTIFDYAPQCKAATDYQQLAEEMLAAEERRP